VLCTWLTWVLRMGLHAGLYLEEAFTGGGKGLPHAHARKCRYLDMDCVRSVGNAGVFAPTAVALAPTATERQRFTDMPTHLRNSGV